MDSRNGKERDRDAGGASGQGEPPSGATHTCRHDSLQKAPSWVQVVHSGSHLSFTFHSGAQGPSHAELGAAGWGAAEGDLGAADRCPLLPAAYLVQAVRAAGKCDEVFKGFSNCLLKLGESVANYPQGLDDKTNVKTMCT